MILLIINNYQKKIAFVLLVIFSLNVIMPNIISATESSHIFLPGIRERKRNHTTPVSVYPFTDFNSAFDLNSERSRLKAGDVSLPEIVMTKEDKEPDDKPFIDGPGQPEMKSFQSVNANNMVDLFTGDFSYSIPLLDVGGYPVNIHYSSGINMDQESSWVGLGWNINPGSVSRSMRGLPDDFDGINDSLKRTQHIKENRTTGVTIEPSLEIVGTPLNVSARLGIFYNNYNGYGLETGVGIGGTARSSFGSLTGNLSISNNSQEGIRINPSLNVGLGNSNNDNNLRGSLGISTGYSSRGGISSLQINGGVQADAFLHTKGLSDVLSQFAQTTISFATPSYSPTISMPMKNKAFSFTGKVGGEIWGVDASAAFTGYVNQQSIADEDTMQVIPAAGYLYSTNSNNRENVLLDFNREKEMEYNYKTTPHIAIPQYTYDAFSISGEGTGGSFRPYRGDIGYVFDHAIATRSSSTNGSVDVGLGAAVHVGLEITNITTTTANHRWNKNNKMESKLNFQSADTTYEPVYFRNPGEKTTNALNYYRAIGNDSLIRIKLSGDKDNVHAENAFVKYNDEGRQAGEIPVTEILGKNKRDKRSQAISYFTAEDASVLGLDKVIKSYQENSIPVGQCTDIIKEIPRVDNNIRKKNHLSEISVLNSDGRKYVYGLPIYNVLQRDVTFAIAREKATQATGMVNYLKGTDNSPKNIQGKDNYFSRDEMPAYAHNFLLTGIVSPDYVDITGNGISEDDPGDAVKFNYTQVYGADSGYFDWRTPFMEDSANYNEGLKTYNRDDKATYLYGKKEMWYLNSLESKTMIAVFHVARDRQDAYSVKGENGGINTAKSSRRLERIDLYVKADLIKNGASKARPVKTVHFSYNYELCKGAQGKPNTGKLTLKSIWFTYNKNNKGKLNPYVFSYHPDENGAPKADYNPAFNSRHSDRWGTYKNPIDNPNGMINADYPYSIQDSIKAAKNASVWNLTDIQLPSGGKMKISYEADDYGYVQNKRATQMVAISGINKPSQNRLYSNSGKTDYDTLYINTPDVLNNKTDLRNKYLDIDEVIYFKLAVIMPADQFGSGTEMVPGYGTIDAYGVSAGNNKQFWITLKKVEGRSPMTRAALQFLRLNLRSKAYPGSEGVDKLGLKELVKLMATSITELKNMIQGFDDAAKSKNYCDTVNLPRSFIRLSNPNHKKYGGGYRVKRVEIFDNWKKMTNQKESVYGQEYNYTTTEDVNGQTKTISSGVATYEPAIGAEENPFRRPINYTEKAAPMAPVNFMFSEEPIGETFFASPMVGYSKVRVRTINAKARSANGWEETEYFTSRDFPAIVEHTLLEPGTSKFKYETQSSILRLNHKNYVTLSQGFKIELNDMNGKVKAQSTYAETDSLHPIKYSLNFYKTDDDKALQKHLNNQVWVVDSANGNINTEGQIGKDIEVMADLREQQSQAFTKGFSPNFDIIAPFLPPWIPILYLPSKLNIPQKEDVRYRSAAVVKIVQRYGILDSVVVMDKGSVISTKNILYDAETGNVLLSRTNNEFNDPIYNFNYPAYWAYSGMDLAYKNLGAVFQSKGITSGGFQLNAGKLYKEGSSMPYPADRFFESGDEVYVYSAVRAVAGSDCRYLNGTGTSWKGKLWVMNAAKGLEKDNGLYFIDSLGRTAPNLIIQKMIIVRSGKRNMQDVSAGNVVMLNNPLKQLIDGRYRVIVDSNSRVLNASTATFKDMWKVENSEYQEDSCYTVQKIDTFSFKSNSKLNPAVFREGFYVSGKKIKADLSPGNISAPYFATSSTKINDNAVVYITGKYYRFSLKSIVRFNTDNWLKPSDSIINAVLNLHAKAPVGVWEGVSASELQYFRQKTRAHYKHGTLYGQTNASNIKQVIKPWDLNTRFNDIVTGTTSVAVPMATDASCEPRDPNVTSMVRDMVKNPSRNNGFLLSLDDIPGGILNEKDSERTLGFSNYETGNPVAPNCVETIAPTLIITTFHRIDTCIKVCRKNISDTATNPYRWGILGNWRMERSYAYYNDRQENDASIKNTNIRKEGVLKSFVPYWSFNIAGITASEDTMRWVWNSAIGSFNRKGFEIENFDPLGRYNSGLYGYNQTLPVAVAQNSRYRELLYDGFEDYGYKTTYCATCPPKREIDFLKGNTGVDTTNLQSHTGLYSIKINNGSESLLTVPVIQDSLKNKTLQTLSAAIDSTAITSTEVIGAGTGLVGAYYMGKRTDYRHCFPGDLTLTRTDPTINFNWFGAPPVTPGPNGCSNTYEVKWTGSIQARYSDKYTFYFRFNGTASIAVNGIKILAVTAAQSGERASSSIFLQAGNLYNFSVTYVKTTGVAPGPVELRWSSFVSQSREIVPSNFLYPATTTEADTTGSVINSVLYYCVKADTVKPFNSIRPTFSPITNTKLTVSAWVRLDVTDCNSTPALDSVIQLHFNTGGTTATRWLKKTGLRIEGWQRYESNITVPSDASAMYLRLKTLSGYNIYVDDIRVQPFNSGMKSFVYNPVNLRLMAELDENNYASFYEYDDDGTLIRVKKETERGIMTIQETRSALFKE